MKLYEQLTLKSAWLAALLYGASGVMLTYEVGARYLFIAPTSWASELSQLCLIYGTLLAMPWALQFRRHIQINAIIHKLSDLNQRRIGIVMMIILIVFSLYVTIYGFEIFYESFEKGRTPSTFMLFDVNFSSFDRVKKNDFRHYSAKRRTLMNVFLRLGK
jgi:C4-dicarboxylate transporter DctQ subunit